MEFDPNKPPKEDEVPPDEDRGTEVKAPETVEQGDGDEFLPDRDGHGRHDDKGEEEKDEGNHLTDQPY